MRDITCTAHTVDDPVIIEQPTDILFARVLFKLGHRPSLFSSAQRMPELPEDETEVEIIDMSCKSISEFHLRTE